jgi:hypothetical protein
VFSGFLFGPQSNIARGIRDGLRGEQLIPAVLRDCRALIFMRPDITPQEVEFLFNNNSGHISWPTHPEFPENIFQSSHDTPLNASPTELLHKIHK